MLYLCKIVKVQMSKKKVGVVCGGFSSESDISIQSGKTVFSNLDRNLWDAYLITIDSSDWTAVDYYNNKYIVSKGDFTLKNRENNLELDVIFNAVHGAPGENGQLAALWELLEIPFSSSDSYNSALTFNKRDCLNVLRAWDVPTAKFFELNQEEDKLGVCGSFDLQPVSWEDPCQYYVVLSVFANKVANVGYAYVSYGMSYYYSP